MSDTERLGDQPDADVSGNLPHPEQSKDEARPSSGAQGRMDGGVGSAAVAAALLFSGRCRKP